MTRTFTACFRPHRGIGFHLLPHWVKPRVAEESFREAEAVALRKLVGDELFDEVFVHFLDTRFYRLDIREDIEAAQPLGFKGLKVVHLEACRPGHDGQRLSAS